MKAPKARISKTPEQRRAELIQAARELFDKNGIERTRVSDIVKKVGVAQGVFYYYFDSKAEMVNAVVEQVETEMRRNIGEILADTQADFYQKLADFIELYINMVDQFLADDEDRLPPPLPEFHEQTPFAWQGHEMLAQSLQALVEQGVENGGLHIQYPRETAMVLLLGLRGIGARRLPTRHMVYTIVEQSLCLPPGKLMQYISGTV